MRAVEPDCAGCVFLGGSFTSVGGLPRNGLAHVLADGTLDSAFAPRVSTDPEPVGSRHLWTVFALDLHDERLYVGGEFNWIDGMQLRGLAAVATDSGAVLPWYPGHGRTVWDIEASASAVYVTTTGGFYVGRMYMPASGVAELDPETARPTTWSPPLWARKHWLWCARRCMWAETSSGRNRRRSGTRWRRSTSSLAIRLSCRRLSSPALSGSSSSPARRSTFAETSRRPGTP